MLQNERDTARHGERPVNAARLAATAPLLTSHPMIVLQVARSVNSATARYRVAYRAPTGSKIRNQSAAAGQQSVKVEYSKTWI
jgi:hypothetical protein